MLEQIELVRTTVLENAPQVGMLLFNGYPELLTFELPDKQNQRNISCIPEGVYVAERVLGVTTLGGTYISETFRLQDVPGRSGILFHIGNTEKDTQGCILLGLKLGALGGAPGVSESKIAFEKFLTLTRDFDSFELCISHI